MRRKTERPNLGGEGDKLLLSCWSPGPLFIIQCENFLDESQGCLCMLCLVGMPVFPPARWKRVDFPLRRQSLFGKSRLVSFFNEVSTDPDEFSSSGLFFVVYISTDVKAQMYFCVLWSWRRGGHVCIIHHLSNHTLILYRRRTKGRHFTSAESVNLCCLRKTPPKGLWN